jgi:TolA-binding protein
MRCVQIKIRMGLLAAVLLALVLLPSSLRAQDTPREVRAKATVAIQQGDYGNAILLLSQLVEWFGKSTKETTAVQLEGVYYWLGTCYFLQGQFGEAREAYDAYLKRYRTGPHAGEVAVYIADSYRFEGVLDKAVRSYREALRKYDLQGDLKADAYAGIIRVYLAADKWDRALPWLRRLYVMAPDFSRRNWAATLLTTAYLKQMDMERVYRLVPYLLTPNSFASRSVLLNMAAIEAGDTLFGDEKYRDALWVYRLVYPHDELMLRSQQHLDALNAKADRLRVMAESPRSLMRVQESIGEIEAEMKALSAIENYDVELHYRIARAYMEIRRYREAAELFLAVREEGDKKHAEEALFFAFRCLTNIQPWDRAFTVGKDYMDTYPGGEYYDQVSIMVGQMYARLEDWPQVIAVLTKALEVSPKHADAAECMFLIGYATFMEEKFADAADWFRKMNHLYPGNPREPDGVYWLGLTLMFDKQFDQAAPQFDAILRRYADTPYLQDAAFRRAVCDYGSSRFREAEGKLEAFVTQYPTNKLCGEAYMMMADTAGVAGDLPKAITRYEAVNRYDVNIEFYNYSMFRSGEMLFELGNFNGVIAHFKDYIKRNREGSNIPLALYWSGRALWDMGEQKGALEFFRQGIQQYGVDRQALGIDLILEEWVGKTKNTSSEVGQRAWQDLTDMMKAAETNKQDVLALRLKRVLLFQPKITEERRNQIVDDLLREENLTKAGVGVLETMMEEARKRTNTEFAIKVANQIVKDFTETDYALSARKMLAEDAVARKDYTTAIKHLTVIKEVFATSSEAAEALLMLGDLYIKQNKFDQADECFKSVLAVKDWKGPLWPAALYGLGDSARLHHNLEQASAYYERIYVMYANYRQWVGKAYLARADCLSRLQLYNKAAEVLTEMLGVAELKDTPEVAQAQAELETLKKKM